MKIKKKNKENSFNASIALSFFLALALIVFTIFFVNIPVSPTHETTLKDVKFDWIGIGDRAFVDTDTGFNDVIEVRKGEIVNLESGKYYWKISKIGGINGLIVDSEISIINQDGKIKNTGNVPILLEFFKKIGRTSRTVLDVDESSKGQGDFVLASQFDDKLELNQTNQTR
jgi:hypothetical protein